MYVSSYIQLERVYVYLHMSQLTLRFRKFTCYVNVAAAACDTGTYRPVP